MGKRLDRLSWRAARKLVVLIVGMTILAVGAAAAVLPFLPAVVIVPIGLAILATEFLWARRLLRRVRDGIQNGFSNSRKTAGSTRAGSASGSGAPDSAPERS